MELITSENQDMTTARGIAFVFRLVNGKKYTVTLDKYTHPNLNGAPYPQWESYAISAVVSAEGPGSIDSHAAYRFN